MEKPYIPENSSFARLLAAEIDMTKVPDISDSEFPEHVRNEGLPERARKSYVNSMNVYRRKDKARLNVWFLDGFFDRTYNQIVLQDSVLPRFLSRNYHEHELIHRLYSGNREDQLGQIPSPEEYFDINDFRPEDRWYFETREDLADKYGVSLEETKALVLSKRDFYNLRLEFELKLIEQTASMNRDGLSNSRDIDEFLARYLTSGKVSDLDSYGFDREEVRRAEEYMEKLDKECGFSVPELVDAFSEYDDFEDLEKGTSELPEVEEDERIHLNGAVYDEPSTFYRKLID